MGGLLEQGVDTVFGYPGGTILNIYDEMELHGYKNKIRLYSRLPMSRAPHAADGYARSTGKVGVCFATPDRAPPTHLTPALPPPTDSSPVVFITCNVVESLIGKDSFQEVDITGSHAHHHAQTTWSSDPGPAGRRGAGGLCHRLPGLVPARCSIDTAKMSPPRRPTMSPPRLGACRHGRLGAMLRRSSHDLKTPEPDYGDIESSSP